MIFTLNIIESLLDKKMDTANLHKYTTTGSYCKENGIPKTRNVYRLFKKMADDGLLRRTQIGPAYVYSQLDNLDELIHVMDAENLLSLSKEVKF